MTDDKLKLVLSITGLFLGGVTVAYGVLPDKNAITLPVVVALVMGGLTAISGYLTGYAQKNPRNNKTAEDLLDSIKGSALPVSVKVQVAPVLAQESAKPGAMGLPLTEQQVAAKQLYQAQKPDLEALEVQRLARARLAPPTQEKAEHDVDALLANIETARAALAARRAQLEAQERRLTTGLAPPTTTTTERAPGQPIPRGTITP